MQEITLQYAITRAELWRWYWRMWLQRLWVLHVGAVSYIFWKLYPLYTKGTINLIELILTWLAIDLCYFVFVISFPQIMFKSQVRTFKVSPVGISTTIGKKQGDIPWAEVDSIQDRGDTVTIVRKKTLNTFIIPNRAFTTPDARNNFLSAIRAWQQSATINKQNNI